MNIYSITLAMLTKLNTLMNSSPKWCTWLYAVSGKSLNFSFKVLQYSLKLLNACLVGSYLFGFNTVSTMCLIDTDKITYYLFFTRHYLPLSLTHLWELFGVIHREIAKKVTHSKKIVTESKNTSHISLGILNNRTYWFLDIL